MDVNNHLRPLQDIPEIVFKLLEKLWDAAKHTNTVSLLARLVQSVVYYCSKEGLIHTNLHSKQMIYSSFPASHVLFCFFSVIYNS